MPFQVETFQIHISHLNEHGPASPSIHVRMHFANAPQCLGHFRSSFQTLADFSTCVLLHDSRRGASTLSLIKKFQRFDPSLKFPTDTHPTEKTPSSLSSVTEQPDNEPQGSISTVRSSPSIGIYEAHRTLPGQIYDEPVPRCSGTIQQKSVVSRRNGFRTLHESLGFTTKLKIEITPPFSSVEPCENNTRIVKININPQTLPKKSEPECFAAQNRGNGVRIRLRLATLDTLKRRNYGQDSVHQKGKHEQGEDLPLRNTEVDNRGDHVRIKLVLEQLNTLKESNRPSEVVHPEGKSLPLVNTEVADFKEKIQDRTRKSVLHSSKQRTKKPLPKACLTSINDHVEPANSKERLLWNDVLVETPRRHSDLLWPASNVKGELVIGKVQSNVHQPREASGDSSNFCRRIDLTASKGEKRSIVDSLKPVIHQPSEPDGRFCDFWSYLDSKTLQPSIAPVRKASLWTPLGPSDSFDSASECERKTDVRKIQSAIHQSSGPDGESSDFTKYRGQKALQKWISPVRKVFLWTPWRHSDTFYPAGEDGNKPSIGTMLPFPTPREGNGYAPLSLDLRIVQHSDHDKPRDSLDKFSLVWRRRFAVIMRGIWILNPWRDFSSLTWYCLITPDMDNKRILQAMSKFPLEEPEEIWREYMLWALQHSPTRALKLLDVTISERVLYVPRYVLVDCLAYLATFYLNVGGLAHRSKLAEIAHSTCKLIQDSGLRERGSPASFDNNVNEILKQVMTQCKIHQPQPLWDMLITRDITLHRVTLFRFLETFRKTAGLVRSMDVLDILSQTGPGLRAKTVKEIGVSLLRVVVDSENGFKMKLQIWDRLVRMGIRPSVHMYNAMIESCVLADQCDTALTLYQQARDRKVTPNRYTYIHLLQGFKQGWGSGVLDLVVRDADAGGMLYKNNGQVFFQILLAKSQLGFPDLLQFYRRYYDVRPLYRFGIVEPGPFLLEPFVWSRSPTTRAVAFMLQQYVRQNPTSPEVVDIYDDYCAALRERNSRAFSMANAGIIPNLFLWAFGRHPTTLKLCTMVIRDIISSAPPSSLQPVARPDKSRRSAVVSWTLLLQAYCRYKQMIAAEKVMTMTRERGIEPDHLMWSVLIYGYATAQDLAGTMNAVKRMEAAGFPINQHVVRALGMYHDRVKMLKRLDDAIKEDSEPEESGSHDELKADSNFQTGERKDDRERRCLEAQRGASFGEEPAEEDLRRAGMGGF